MLVPAHVGQAPVDEWGEAMSLKDSALLAEEAEARIPARPSAVYKDWRALSADSDRLVVQELIRADIRKGSIRVCPLPGDPTRVQIIRLGAVDSSPA